MIQFEIRKCKLCPKETLVGKHSATFFCDDCKKTDAYKKLYYTKQKKCEKCNKIVFVSKFSSKKKIICDDCIQIEKTIRKEELKKLIKKECKYCGKPILVRRRNCILVCDECKKSSTEFRKSQNNKKIKREETNLKKYGFKNLFEDSKMIKDVLLKKYNVTSSMQIPGIKDKIKKTNLQRYGVENCFQITEKITATLFKKYGARCPYRFTGPHKKLKSLIDICIPKNEFETEKDIKIGEKRFSIDEVDLKNKIAIFVDGDYWHANPKKVYKQDQIIGGRTVEKIKERDTFVTQTLCKNDFLVVRLWENEINNLPQYCIDQVKQAIKMNNVKKISKQLIGSTTTYGKHLDFNDQNTIKYLNQLLPYIN